MDLNFIPYNIFQFPYRTSGLDMIFISKKLAAERFFSAVDRPDAEYLDELAANLSELYDVTDEKSAFERIKVFDDHAYFCALVTLFRRAEGELGTINFTEFSANFLTDEDVKSALEAVGVKFDEKDFADIKAALTNMAKESFEGGETQKFLKFSRAVREFWPFCERTGIRAFDYAVILQIAANAFAVGYIAQKDFEEIVAHYGERAAREFGCWSEFMAGYVLGGMYIFFDEKTVKSDLKYRATPIYTCLTSPYDMFKASGIWADSADDARAKLGPILEKYVDLSEFNAQKEENLLIVKELEEGCEKSGLGLEDFACTLDAFYDDFYGFFKNRRCEELMRTPEQTYAVTPLSTLEGGGSVLEEARKLAAKFKLKFDADELPLIKFETALLTNKAVYIEGRLPFFKKAKKITWKQARPRVAFHYTDELRCYVSEADYFAIDMSGYKKAAHKKSTIDDGENAKTFRDEITALNLAMTRLKERFSED